MAKVISIGQMREDILIQTRTHTPDGGTSLTEAFATITGGSVRAHVEDLSRVARAGTVHTGARGLGTHIFTVRFRTDVLRTHWIKWRSRYYRILEYGDPDNGKRVRLEILAEEERGA